VRAAGAIRSEESEKRSVVGSKEAELPSMGSRETERTKNDRDAAMGREEYVQSAGKEFDVLRRVRKRWGGERMWI
jgi:hypothetical protein